MASRRAPARTPCSLPSKVLSSHQTPGAGPRIKSNRDNTVDADNHGHGPGTGIYLGGHTHAAKNKMLIASFSRVPVFRFRFSIQVSQFLQNKIKSYTLPFLFSSLPFAAYEYGFTGIVLFRYTL